MSIALRVLLGILGTLLSVAARASSGFRAAITRDLVFEIATEDGVARHFVFRNRQVSAHAGPASAPDCALRFATARQALAIFLSRRAVGKIYDGVLDGSITIHGNAFRVLWFYDLTQRVVPLAERVAWATPPGAYKSPSATEPWSRRILREAVATELDPAWEGAVRQRAKLKMMRVAAGEPTLEF